MYMYVYLFAQALKDFESTLYLANICNHVGLRAPSWTVCTFHLVGCNPHGKSHDVTPNPSGPLPPEARH